MPGKINQGHKSIKHEIIDKTNSRMLATVGVATFVFIFSIFATKSLIGQSMYHGRVIAEKQKALTQLNDNKKAVDELKKSFDIFQGENQNVLGGDPDGSGQLDGKNDKIILDSLPNKYDYPALSSSFEKILKDGGYQVGTIGGSEDPTLSANSLPSGSAVASVVPYAFSVSSDVVGIKNLLQILERSIRPMYVDSLQFQVGGGVLDTSVKLHTYFAQPKTFELGSKEIK